jgi:hypothetical protein
MIQSAVLIGVENFRLYMQRQPLKEDCVLIRSARFWTESYDTFMTLHHFSAYAVP